MYLINAGFRRLRITQNKCQLIAESLSSNSENESNITQLFKQNQILPIKLKSNNITSVYIIIEYFVKRGCLINVC